MPQRSSLNSAGRTYVAIVTGIGLSLIAYSLHELFASRLGPQLFLLAGLTLLSGSFTIRIPTIPARLSVSETFVFAAAILFGPPAATIIVVLDSLIASLWLRRPSRHLSRLLFNVSAPATAIWVAATSFFWVAAVPPLSVSPQPILSLVFPLLLMALLYFLFNSFLIAIAVGFEQQTSFITVWHKNFVWLSLNYFSGASVAALLLPYITDDEQHAFLRLAVTLLPLLLISYLTFKTALGRVEDANRHLSELNRLYLSTIETLAMAIDAKDQITHGHIRRVQHYAIGLAQRMGITDRAQLSAIEAASLLHDMGKLAVPEYILNKPGRLTPAEFERMKLHASVGADILSAIHFPYPVVPIVRHHHENWDGSGYPDGLEGGDIPIGARILSVVDCFDALTSDRPYRPRLTDADAIKILLERRGSMYDPLIVDTFVAVHAEISPGEEHTPHEEHLPVSASTPPLHPLHKTATETRLNEIAASRQEALVLLDLARTLSGQNSFKETAEAVWQHLRTMVPATLCVVFIYDATTDELIASYASGEHAGHFSNMRIARGQRLSGWVAANRQTIVNSDPILDFGESSRSLRPSLKSSLSSPIVYQDTLLGVLSAYACTSSAFSDDHRRVIEAIIGEASPVFARVSSKGVEYRNDRGEALLSPVTSHSQFSIILLKYLDNSLNSGSPIISTALEDVATALRNCLDVSYTVLPSRNDEILVLLTGIIEPNSDAKMHIAEQVQIAARRWRTYGALQFDMAEATAPVDGSSLEELLLVARRRTRRSDETAPNARSIH